MKATSEKSTSPAVTFGETPFSIFITPNTIQGARPISVKIQPALLAT